MKEEQLTEVLAVTLRHVELMQEQLTILSRLLNYTIGKRKTRKPTLNVVSINSEK